MNNKEGFDSLIMYNGTIEVYLSKRFFEKEAVFAAAFSITNKYRVKIEPAAENNVKIIIFPIKEGQTTNKAEIVNSLLNKLIDEQLRLDLEKRYGRIRELIIEHAFSPLENLRAKVQEISGRV